MTRKDVKGDQPSGGETNTGQILERHDLVEDSTRQANLETACLGLGQTTGHYDCQMMMKDLKWFFLKLGSEHIFLF